MKKNKKNEVLKMNLAALKMVCNLRESSFELLEVDGKTPQIFDTPDGQLLYWNRGAKILGVAHLDTYGEDKNSFHKIGARIYNASLDDRLGVYTLMYQLIHLPYDILLTTGEESGRSTAAHFESPKQYNFMFSFDRGGHEAVLYDYSDIETRDLLKKHKYTIGRGSFSDISYLEHLECKGFNLATEYYDYHGQYAYMKIQEYFKSIRKFMNLFEDVKNVHLAHEEIVYNYPTAAYSWNGYPYDSAYGYTSKQESKMIDADINSVNNLMNCAYCDDTKCDGESCEGDYIKCSVCLYYFPEDELDSEIPDMCQFCGEAESYYRKMEGRDKQ